MRKPILLVDAKCVEASGMSVLVDFDGKEYRIPRSQIYPESQVQDEGDRGILAIPPWLAERLGLL